MLVISWSPGTSVAAACVWRFGITGNKASVTCLCMNAHVYMHVYMLADSRTWAAIVSNSSYKLVVDHKRNCHYNLGFILWTKLFLPKILNVIEIIFGTRIRNCSYFMKRPWPHSLHFCLYSTAKFLLIGINNPCWNKTSYLVHPNFWVNSCFKRINSLVPFTLTLHIFNGKRYIEYSKSPPYVKKLKV